MLSVFCGFTGNVDKRAEYVEMKVIQYLRLKDDGVDSMAEMMFWHQMDAVRFHPIHPAVERIPNSLQGLKKRGKHHETNRLHHSDEHILMCLC